MHPARLESDSTNDMVAADVVLASDWVLKVRPVAWAFISAYETVVTRHLQRFGNTVTSATSKELDPSQA